MRVISIWADAIRCNRIAARSEVSFKAFERGMIEDVSALWEAVRKVRDATQERAFHELYESGQTQPASTQEHTHD